MAVIGAGSFGRHHLKILSKSPNAQLAGVVDSSADRAAAAAAEYACPIFTSPEELAGCMTRTQSEFNAPIEQGFVERRADSKEWFERHWVEDFARIARAVSEA